MNLLRDSSLSVASPREKPVYVLGLIAICGIFQSTLAKGINDKAGKGISGLWALILNYASCIHGERSPKAIKLNHKLLIFSCIGR